jgi:WD40 repeat protein
MPTRYLLIAFPVVLVFLSLTAAQDGEKLQKERDELDKTPLAGLYPPSLFEKVRQLRTQAEQGNDAIKTELLHQQARWLLPDPQLVPPTNVSRILGSLKFKHDDYPTAVTYSGDGKSLFTASRDGTVRHWDLANGRTLHLWDLGKPLSSLAVSADAKWLAAAEGYLPSPNLDLATITAMDEYLIHVIDLTTFAKRWDLKGHGKSTIHCLAFGADNRTLASGAKYSAAGGDTVRFWDMTTGKELPQPKDNVPMNTTVVNTVWSKDQTKLFITSDNRTFGIFNRQTKMLDQSIREIGAVHALALSPDGDTLALGGEFAETTNVYNVHLYSTRDWKISGKLTGHGAPVLGLAFHPGGKQLVAVTARPEAMVRVWDLSQKTATAQYQGHAGDILDVALRHNGEQIATVSLDQSIRLWQASKVKPPRTIAQVQAPVWVVLPGAQEKQVLSVSADQTASVWELASGKSVTKYTEHRNPVTAAAYRPGFGEVATGGGDHVIRLWDPATGKTNQTLNSHGGVITSLTYSPDGKFLYTASADRTVKAWNLSEKKAVYTLDQHRSVVTSVAVNLDGSLLATGGADNTIRIWKTGDGKPVRTLIGHNGAVTGLTFSPGGQLLASVGADGVCKIWDPGTRNDALRTLTGHNGQLMAVTFSPNHKYIATAGADEVIRVWNLANGQELRALKGHTDWVTSLAYLSDGESLLSASVDGSVRLWEESKAAEVLTYGHRQPVHYLAMSPKGDRVASASDDGQIILWDPATGNDVATLRGHLSGVTAIAFSSDGKLLVSGDEEKTLKLWDVPAGRELASIQTTAGSLLSMAFLGGDRGLAVGLGGADIGLWKYDAEKRTLVEPFPNDKSKNKFLAVDSAPKSISFGRDRLVLGSYDGSARVCDIKGFQNENGPRLNCYTNAVEELCLNPDGTKLVTVNGDSQFKLWDVTANKTLKMWGGRNSKVRTLAVNADASRVLSSHESNELVLADTASGKELRAWKFRGPIRYLVFAPNAKQAYAGAESGVVYQLDLP